MKRYPSIPRVDSAPTAILERGHLWIQEEVDGLHLRFRVEDSGLIVFGDRDRVYERRDVPPPYGVAVRQVRERLDRDTLRREVDDVEKLTFFGQAPCLRTIDYDWDRTPGFLGFDIWSADRGAFYPEDVVERAFRRVGLSPVNTFAKEVPARQFSPDRYDMPGSNWYDGPPLGVLLRNKNGPRAKLRNPSVDPAEVESPGRLTPEEAGAEAATDRRIETAIGDLESAGKGVSVDRVSERVFEMVAREEYARLVRGMRSDDVEDLRSGIEARVRESLGYT